MNSGDSCHFEVWRGVSTRLPRGPSRLPYSLWWVNLSRPFSESKIDEFRALRCFLVFELHCEPHTLSPPDSSDHAQWRSAVGISEATAPAQEALGRRPAPVPPSAVVLRIVRLRVLLKLVGKPSVSLLQQ